MAVYAITGTTLKLGSWMPEGQGAVEKPGLQETVGGTAGMLLSSDRNNCSSVSQQEGPSRSEAQTLKA